MSRAYHGVYVYRLWFETVDSSSHFHFRAWTHRHTQSQTQLITQPMPTWVMIKICSWLPPFHKRTITIFILSIRPRWQLRTYLAHSANLPEGLYILLMFFLYFFNFFSGRLSSQRSWDTNRAIFTKISGLVDRCKGLLTSLSFFIFQGTLP